MRPSAIEVPKKKFFKRMTGERTCLSTWLSVDARLKLPKIVPGFCLDSVGLVCDGRVVRLGLSPCLKQFTR